MKKAKSILRVALFTISSLNAFAQKSDKIEAERPGKSQTPFVVPVRTFQAEIGLDYEKQRIDTFEYQEPELLLRYGLLNRVELRATIRTVTDEIRHPKSSTTGLQPIELGLKTLVTEGRGILPHTSLTADFGIPSFATKSFKADKVFPKIRLTMQNNLSDKISLLYSGGPEWNGKEEGVSWLYTIGPQFEVGEKCEMFVEEYAYLQHDKSPEHVLDAGIAYFISKNVKADIFAGTGLSEEASKYFISAGLSFRF